MFSAIFMVHLGLSMSFYKMLLYGWTLEKDPVTDQYIYGSVPRFLSDCKSRSLAFAKSKIPKALRKTKSFFSRLHSNFANNFPRTYLACVAAAATIGYFVGVSIAWGIAFKVLKFLRIV